MDNYKPLITVLLPVYNGEKYLGKAIDSILTQSFKNFELLIINDCSKDNSRDIIHNYNDPRIKVVNNKENLGLTNTLNKGLEIAKGKYIARIDQDDISVKDRLEKQMLYLEHSPSTKLVGSWGKIIDENGKFIRSAHFPCSRKKILEAFVSYNPFLHSSVIFDKVEILKLGGYPKSFVHAQDYFLWYNITSKFKVHNIPEELVSIRWHNQRATDSELHLSYIKKESLNIYSLALKNPEIRLFVKLKGKLCLFLKPWSWSIRKFLGLKLKF